MKYVKQFLLCYLLLFSFTLTAQDLPKLAKENINFMMVNDMGGGKQSFIPETYSEYYGTNS